jgi:hypothetical protein
MSVISGLPTIRAFKKEEEFTQHQINCFDVNKRVRLTKSGLENWFSLTLSFVSFLINIPCIAFAMFSGNTDPAMMGLLMVYALKISDNVVYLTQN